MTDKYGEGFMKSVVTLMNRLMIIFFRIIIPNRDNYILKKVINSFKYITTVTVKRKITVIN